MLSNTCKYGIRSIIYIALNTEQKSKKIGIKEMGKGKLVPLFF